MDSPIQISSPSKHIPIIRDGENVGVLIFDPNDVAFAERFYRLVGELDTKYAEYQKRADELEANQKTDANDLPVNLGERIEFIKDVCIFFRERIDVLFGPGTSQIVFGDSLNIDLFPQFLNAIEPHIRQARTEKIQKYAPPTKRKHKRK